MKRKTILAVVGIVLAVTGAGAVVFVSGGNSSEPPAAVGGVATAESDVAGSSPTTTISSSQVSTSPSAERKSVRDGGLPYSDGALPEDPTADPGPDPVFANDPDLRRNEGYSFQTSKPGDHQLAEGTLAFQYDVTTNALKARLAERKPELAKATGIALYLTGGTALSDGDLAALQGVHRDLGLNNLSRLHVYNLRSIQGGRECTPASGLPCAGQQARGGNFPYLWHNGWWGTWVKQLVLDDLDAVPDGAFSNHNFSEVRLRGARSIGVMAFGHAPYAKLSVLYLPSVRTIAHDAFRRNQYLVKVNLPNATEVNDFAFDDASRLQYFAAPQLRRLGRNALNDSHELVSVNLPKLEYLGINCFDLNHKLIGLRLPALTEMDKNAVTGFSNLRWVHAPRLTTVWHNAITNNAKLTTVVIPAVTRLGPGAVRGNPALTGVHLGSTPPRQEADVFTGSTKATVYHTGDPAAWASFKPSGAPGLAVRPAP
ncbi:leucine-rich repeat protein [Lentzea sp. PSKA42]|uniref:Leucine-rich repeat protein n=1 Tax=Lentzea indica TaxID=2604800 RepID=A0ABX1FZB1_9PSEU|nr:leucine-rich repeat protein [Lentzea indica]NKE63811.1 leucine-rich repeat protein [Lentzea indica]